MPEYVYLPVVFTDESLANYPALASFIKEGVMLDTAFLNPSFALSTQQAPTRKKPYSLLQICAILGLKEQLKEILTGPGFTRYHKQACKFALNTALVYNQAKVLPTLFKFLQEKDIKFTNANGDFSLKQVERYSDDVLFQLVLHFPKVFFEEEIALSKSENPKCSQLLDRFVTFYIGQLSRQEEDDITRQQLIDLAAHVVPYLCNGDMGRSESTQGYTISDESYENRLYQLGVIFSYQDIKQYLKDNVHIINPTQQLHKGRYQIVELFDEEVGIDALPDFIQKSLHHPFCMRSITRSHPELKTLMQSPGQLKALIPHFKDNPTFSINFKKGFWLDLTLIELCAILGLNEQVEFLVVQTRFINRHFEACVKAYNNAIRYHSLSVAKTLGIGAALFDEGREIADPEQIIRILAGAGTEEWFSYFADCLEEESVKKRLKSVIEKESLLSVSLEEKNMVSLRYLSSWFTHQEMHDLVLSEEMFFAALAFKHYEAADYLATFLSSDELMRQIRTQFHDAINEDDLITLRYCEDKLTAVQFLELIKGDGDFLVYETATFHRAKEVALYLLEHDDCLSYHEQYCLEEDNDYIQQTVDAYVWDLRSDAYAFNVRHIMEEKVFDIPKEEVSKALIAFRNLLRRYHALKNESHHFNGYGWHEPRPDYALLEDIQFCLSIPTLAQAALSEACPDKSLKALLKSIRRRGDKALLTCLLESAPEKQGEAELLAKHSALFSKEEQAEKRESELETGSGLNASL